MPHANPRLAAAARIELANRELARRHVLAFTQYTYADYRPDPMHALIAQHLDAVVDKKLRFLMIFAPPQHGKTELVTVRLPGFWLGRRPDEPVAIVTYGAELAEPKSREARGVVESEEYARLFPDTKVSREARAMAHWEIEGRRGFVHAVGIGGAITGHGFGLGIVDDPHKDYAEAMSATRRKAVIDYYKSTFRQRIREGGAIVIINTRWHMEDLCGTLLKEQPGVWTVLRLPAMAETQEVRDFRDEKLGLTTGRPDPLGRAPGEPVAPQRFSAAALLELKQHMPGHSWAAQYDGFPTAAEGGMFKFDSFKPVDSVPRNCRRIRYWDKAGTSKGGAYTAGVLMAFDTDHRTIYIEDVRRGQWSIAQRERQIEQTANTDRMRYGRHTAQEPLIWLEQEPASAGKESAENTIRNLIQKGFTARAETASGEKEVRAQPYADWAETFGVFVMRAPWTADYVDELTSVPNGAYWDQVDASSGAFNKLVKGGAWSRTYANKGGRKAG